MILLIFLPSAASGDVAAGAPPAVAQGRRPVGDHLPRPRPGHRPAAPTPAPGRQDDPRDRPPARPSARGGQALPGQHWHPKVSQGCPVVSQNDPGLSSLKILQPG